MYTYDDYEAVIQALAFRLSTGQHKAEAIKDLQALGVDSETLYLALQAVILLEELLDSPLHPGEHRGHAIALDGNTRLIPSGYSIAGVIGGSALD